MLLSLAQLQLSPDQIDALDLLHGRGNVFLTGRAGTGKSSVLRRYLAEVEQSSRPTEIAVLASTGAAAVLVGGRTFHSFFGLGILEGGQQKTVERALKNPRLRQRLKATDQVVIDEVSMLSGETLATAEQVARQARLCDEPWGGLRIIAVGDFLQLPPVSRDRAAGPDWAFQHEVWTRSAFRPALLETVHRTQDADWLAVLNQIREGRCSEEVRAALEERRQAAAFCQDQEVTRLFGRRDEAERYNQQRLQELEGEAVALPTAYLGEEMHVQALQRSSPIPDILYLKPGALVMLRRNETNGLYVNGSLAHVRRCDKDQVEVELLENGMVVDLEPVKFEWLNAEGEVVASARNFPLNLAYGSTIHKSQGATLDRLRLRLSGLWESGQAYVALSRVRPPPRLYLDSWDARSIRVDSRVLDFTASLRS
jgi:ATP-dependent DNA helicase PIF1